MNVQNKISCRMNVLDLEMTDYLLYRTSKPEFALVRASITDEKGNLSLQDEETLGTIFSIRTNLSSQGHVRVR